PSSLANRQSRCRCGSATASFTSASFQSSRCRRCSEMRSAPRALRRTNGALRFRTRDRSSKIAHRNTETPQVARDCRDPRPEGWRAHGRGTWRNVASHCLVYLECGARALLEAAMTNPQSTAKIAGHPIHPMLIPFPIAFFVATFVCDLVYWQTASAAWATAATWLLGAGIIMAALAAIAGLTDVLGDQRIRALNDAWWHAGGNLTVVLIEIYNWYARYSAATSAVVPRGPILSLIVVCI